MGDAGYDPALAEVGRRIDAIDNVLERAICESLYRTPAQRRQRLWISILLGLKHMLRGISFSWPLYLPGVAALVLPDRGSAWLGAFLLPGFAVSCAILYRGIVEDYRRFLHRVLLRPGATRHILWPDSP